ncbi:hypothetical protein VA596_22760 [Amycolatopsis sp., V23-08]|uniref:Uncharacterized protein n=1 Tax=Amycolatopsis heterodermiae TaxID=3110235 RepID=A0ABU5R816_9PSEU|nr:hypothetical protein [Amycolatopsis sp., V23-08]MEA5362377.1 hypothetical protein [Amycolatopsis sp., V23-08]
MPIWLFAVSGLVAVGLIYVTVMKRFGRRRRVGRQRSVPARMPGWQAPGPTAGTDIPMGFSTTSTNVPTTSTPPTIPPVSGNF